MTLHKWLVGFALAMIMIAALSVNAFLFSARSFQFNLAQVSPGSSGILMVDRLREVSEEIEKIEAATTDTRGAAKNLEDQFQALNGQINSKREEINRTTTDLAQGVANLEENLGRSAGVEPAAALAPEDLMVRAAAVASTPGLPADQSRSASTIQQLSRHLGELQDQLTDLQELQNATQYQLRGAQSLLTTSDNQIAALKMQIVDKAADFDRVKSEAASLERTSPLGIGVALVGMHPTYTSTLLVLLMGALGAILYLFPAYMSRANPVTFAEIAMRMLFGMVTALAFYIVANATIAGLSFVPGQTAAANNAALLNPFTVGLVGIVAGIMADDIARWIQRRGSEILGGNVNSAPLQPTPPSGESGGAVNPHGGPPPV